MNLDKLNQAARAVLLNQSTDLTEAATVQSVIKALKLKGGKDADALINKMRDLGLESKVSKAHAEAAKKILKGQIAKFVKNESTDLEEAKLSAGGNSALKAIDTLTMSLKPGGKLNKAVNKTAEGNYDSDFKKMHKAILDIENIFSDIVMDIEDNSGGMNESTDLETSNTLTKDEYDEVQNFKSFNEKDWKWVASKKQFIRKTPVKS